MKIPIKIIDCDFYGNQHTEYKFNKVVYKGCYEYIHFWLNGNGKWKCFKCYLERGNILFEAWIHRYDKDYKSRFNYIFIGEIEINN